MFEVFKKKYNNSSSPTLASFLTTAFSSPGRTDKLVLQLFEQSPLLHSIIEKISSSCAQVEYEVYNIKNNTVSENHPFLSVVNNFNPLLPGILSKALVFKYLDLIGRAFIVIEKTGIKTSQLLVLDPTTLVKEPSSEDLTYTFIIGTVTKTYSMRDVIKIHNPAPLNPYNKATAIGIAVLQEVLADEAAARYVESFFANSAKPSIIVSGEGLKTEDVSRLEETFNNKFKGAVNAFKTFFVNRKLDVIKLDQSMKDLDIVALRKHLRDAVVQAAGVAPEIIGINDTSNRGNATTALHNFNENTVKPRVSLFCSFINESIVSREYPGYALRPKPFVHFDKEFLLSVMQRFPLCFTIQEVRALVGKTGKPDELDIVPDGKKPGNPEVKPTESDINPNTDLRN